MPCEVAVIANRMLPKAPLPDSAFARLNASCRQAFAARDVLGECGLDQAPARREIRIARRQRSDAMQVIRQDDDRICPERPRLANMTYAYTQQVDMPGQQITPTFEQGDGEEERATGNPCADILRHRWGIPCA